MLVGTNMKSSASRLISVGLVSATTSALLTGTPSSRLLRLSGARERERACAVMVCVSRGSGSGCISESESVSGGSSEAQKVVAVTMEEEETGKVGVEGAVLVLMVVWHTGRDGGGAELADWPREEETDFASLLEVQSSGTTHASIPKRMSFILLSREGSTSSLSTTQSSLPEEHVNVCERSQSNLG